MKSHFSKYIRRSKAALLLALTTGAVALASCDDFLDVTPKSQLEEGALFSRESGYDDQLTGVYTQMMGSSMYGMQMTFGFAEVLSQNYNINPNSNVWRYVKDYDYRNSSVESILSGIWLGTYSCIANLNILIENIERADKNIFTAGNDSVYLGEALGLRAFLHLELMRYFACAPSMDRQAKGVPYVTTYGTHVTEQKTVDETMNLIIADLLKARDLLTADPSNVDGPRFSYDQSQVRKARFNYNACVGALARAYMWNGDKANALRYAKEIIAVNDPDDEKARSGYPFSWVHYTVFQSTQKTDYQPSFYTEHLMRITVNNWEDGGNTYFHAAKGVDALSPSYEYANDVYELSAGMGTDYRLAYCFEQDGSDRYLSKFWYVEGRAANGYLPVLRMTEAYYIAAECLKDTAPEKAIAILEKVRTNRHLDLSPLPTTLTSAEIQNEIFKEYRKEFMGEGQLFFYYKRLNATDINGSPQKGSKSVYVMPIPSTNQEFGGYTN